MFNETGLRASLAVMELELLGEVRRRGQAEAHVKELTGQLRLFIGEAQVQDWSQAPDEEVQAIALKWCNTFHGNKRRAEELAELLRDLAPMVAFSGRHDLGKRIDALAGQSTPEGA